ncbi:MAG: hypothetical protein PHC75_08835, partial [Burkholderiales bacterium]|nr:hypothetical protein [Burkholderiales bacterium]
MRKFNNNSFIKVTYRKINTKPKTQSLPYGIWSRRIVDYLARLEYLGKNKNKKTSFTINKFLEFYNTEVNQDNIDSVTLQIQLLMNCEFDVLMKPKSGLTTNYNNIRFFDETSDLALSTELKKLLRSHPIPISNAVAGIVDCFTYDLFNYVHYVNFSATKYKQKIDIEIDELYETVCNKEMQGRRREGNPHDYFANANKTKLEKFKAQLNQALNDICKLSPIVVEVEKTKTIKGWISKALISNYGCMIITPTPDALFKRVEYPTTSTSDDVSTDKEVPATSKCSKPSESSTQNNNNVY